MRKLFRIHVAQLDRLRSGLVDVMYSHTEDRFQSDGVRYRVQLPSIAKGDLTTEVGTLASGTCGRSWTKNLAAQSGSLVNPLGDPWTSNLTYIP